jgi:hypothetical protein
MKTQLTIQQMAMGHTKIHEVFVIEGDIVEEEVTKTDLPAALRAQEQLGKTLKIFTDKVELDASVTVIDYKISEAATPQEAADAYQDMMGC